MWMFGPRQLLRKLIRYRLHKTKTIGAAHDVGYAINPVGCLQQIEGAIIMGLGHAFAGRNDL